MDGSPFSNKTGFATRAIHHGYAPKDAGGALTPPVHMSSTFTFNTVEEAGAAFSGEHPAHFYSRISNPTVEILEQRMASLENGEAAVAFASGMGAITAVLWSFLAPGDEILADKTLYGCTYAFLKHGLAKFGVKVRFADLSDVKAAAEAMTFKTKIVYFESPANPTMRLVDIATVSALAHTHGAKVIVDNTYASPYLTRPLDLGADIVVHSATKYLGGHGDLIAGLAVGRHSDMHEVRVFGLKDMTGAAMSPFTAMLVMRGLKTLPLRMERHSANAMEIAQALDSHPKVATVFYPGLESFPQKDLAARQMRDFGGMIAFELDCDARAAMRFMNALNMIARAVSLGDAESLIQHPASMTHSTYTPEERAAHGISESLIRLSVGLEDVEDIRADLFQALHQI
ncbi:methionine gamma-lyase [Woodsholea maritima]|uniref:methionine gamma-lyase n=1 Tax=Woodsholea maritima TaxID=240237 RepID=UPI00036E74EA|nr:methionine gamma-lyase [Woodsholea maritima]